MANKRSRGSAKKKAPKRAKKATAKKATAKKATAKKATAKKAASTTAPARSQSAGSFPFFVFGQDVRVVGARTAINSIPNSVMMGTMPDGPIPVHIDDPLRRGDSEPSGGASKLGDIVSGAFSLYSPKLQKALTDFGVKFNFKPVQIFVPGKEAPVEGYAWARGAPSVEVKSNEFFTVDEAETQGHALFDATVNYADVRVVNAALKAHLEAVGLEGVYFVPTEEYGGALAIVLKMG